MDYFTIEQYFLNGKLEEVLALYKEDFEAADSYSKEFMNNILISPVECQEALDILTGLYMKFNVVYSIADFQYQKKKELAKTNKDLSSVSMTFLRIRNIFKAYIDNVKRAISTSQSQLKYWGNEIRLTK
jgi:hypothetical protein